MGVRIDLVPKSVLVLPCRFRANHPVRTVQPTRVAWITVTPALIGWDYVMLPGCWPGPGVAVLDFFSRKS
jgi:hypothetical protein